VTQALPPLRYPIDFNPHTIATEAPRTSGVPSVTSADVGHAYHELMGEKPFETIFWLGDVPLIKSTERETLARLLGEPHVFPTPGHRSQVAQRTPSGTGRGVVATRKDREVIRDSHCEVSFSFQMLCILVVCWKIFYEQSNLTIHKNDIFICLLFSTRFYSFLLYSIPLTGLRRKSRAYVSRTRDASSHC